MCGVWGCFMFYVYGNGLSEDKDILKYLRVKPTAMAAWQVYLLMTSNTVMPVFWHGGYIVRTFIFKEDDLNSIKQMKILDLSDLCKGNRLLPTVSIQTEGANRIIADIYCCYWNNWKGLVREHSRVVIEDSEVESYDVVDEFVYYKYDCGLRF